jgi:hypothetical protein
VTSLPKRGDRVRVTEALDTLLYGKELVLMGDAAKAVPEGFVTFYYEGEGAPFSGRVRVEILERAIHPSHVSPGGGYAPLCQACGESTGLREPCRGHSAEFARGMRRALYLCQQLVDGHPETDWTKAEAAIEKELAK